MRFKYYLRGIGFGILVTTLIFVIAIAAKGGIMTDEKAISRAEELGYTLAESSDAVQTEDSSDTSMTISEFKDSASSDATSSSGERDEQSDVLTQSSENEDIETSTTTDEEGASTTTESSSLKKGNTISITISGNSDSADLADRLYDAGIIEDAEDFDAYLVKNGYDTKLQPGSYEFSSGMTYAEIVAELLD